VPKPSVVWTDDRDAELRRLFPINTAEQIAGKLGAGLTRSAVLARAARLKLTKRYTDPAAKFESLIDIVADAPLNQPVTLFEAARRVGLSKPDASRMWNGLVCDLGLHPRDQGDQFRVLA
jgi:hypothetical protein